MSCIFCMIGKGEIPSQTVYENEYVRAFLDLSQAGKGHTLVVPKKHADTLLDLDETTYLELMKAVQLVAKAVDKAFAPDGINILNNCKEAAGQSVMHAHVHIIPRYKDDKISFHLVNNENKYDLKEIANKIKENI